MIIDKEIEIIANNYILKYYRDKGYNIKSNQKFTVKIEDLSETSKSVVKVKCDICDKEKSIMYYLYIKSFQNGGLYTCSNKCSSEKRKNTNLEKFGTEHASQSTLVKNKMKSTNIERYGVDNFSKTVEYKDKIKETNLERYGVEHYSKTDEYKENYKETMLERYGVDNAFKSDKIKDKIKETNLEKYGVEHVAKSKELRDKKNHKKINSIYLNDDNYKFISSDDGNLKFLHIKCGNQFIIKTVNHYIRKIRNINLCTKCYPISDNKSIKEKEIINWLKETDNDVFEGNRDILNGKELDIYIPSHNLAIEFNGLYWHSEIYKDKNYHLDKSIECQKQNIQLIHIWEDEWVFKQDIVKSIMLNKLSKIYNKIYARRCDIRVVEDTKLIRQFLDDNHIQGYSPSSIKLGLYYNEELVSLITFGKRMIKKNVEFELLRFCNKINLNVIGAASKLFTYFKKNYKFTDLISYSDFRLFDGKMYETLGFSKKHLSKPEYYWCKGLERYHRSKFMLYKLIKEGYDPNKTEVEIMHEREYYRIFGCGQYRWEFKNI